MNWDPAALTVTGLIATFLSLLFAVAAHATTNRRAKQQQSLRNLLSAREEAVTPPPPCSRSLQPILPLQRRRRLSRPHGRAPPWPQRRPLLQRRSFLRQPPNCPGGHRTPPSRCSSGTPYHRRPLVRMRHRRVETRHPTAKKSPSGNRSRARSACRASSPITLPSKHSTSAP